MLTGKKQLRLDYAAFFEIMGRPVIPRALELIHRSISFAVKNELRVEVN